MIRIWNFADGKLLSNRSVEGPAEPSAGIVRFAVSPDGKFLATATWKDRHIRLWSLPSGKPFGKPLEHARYITTVAFSPDGKLLLTVATQGSAQLWSVANGVKVGTPARYNVAGAAGFSRDGQFYFTAGYG